MTTIIYDRRGDRITISGHAGAGPKGEDLVCAAVSALGWTLLRAALEIKGFHVEYELDEEKGYMDIKCSPGPLYEGKCFQLYHTIAGGLETIAEKYPEHVRMETF